MNVVIEGVSVDIAGARLLDDVSVTITAGETLGIVGSNGSGKSTLLRCLYRALTPATGAVHIDGDDVRALAHRDVARRLAVLAQHEEAALDFTVREVVELGRHPHPRDVERDTRIVEDAMRVCDVTAMSERSILSLSGGERQRVMLARALAQDCPVLALDEPTNHLDLRHQYGVVAHATRSERTVLVALHDLNLAAAVCDRLLVMRAGRVVAVGEPDTVLTPDLVEDVYGVRPTLVSHPGTGRPHLIFDAISDALTLRVPATTHAARREGRAPSDRRTP